MELTLCSSPPVSGWCLIASLRYAFLIADCSHPFSTVSVVVVSGALVVRVGGGSSKGPPKGLQSHFMGFLQSDSKCALLTSESLVQFSGISGGARSSSTSSAHATLSKVFECYRGEKGGIFVGTGRSCVGGRGRA